MTVKATVCRPRVEGAREGEILDATFDLLAEVGYDRLTMDAVAARAKAGKATLYRRWDDKCSLVIDALIRARGAPPTLTPDTGSLRGDLLALACGQGALTSAKPLSVLAGVITAIQRDAEFAQQFRSRFIGPKVEASKVAFTRAKERGEISADIDVELLAPALAGIVVYRLFILGQPTDETSIERVVDEIILPAATRQTSRPRTQGNP